MKFIPTLLIVILAGYGGFKLIEPHLPSNQPVPQQPETSKLVNATPVGVTVHCHHCRGLGKLVDDSGTVKIGYTCPLCNGAGKKTLPPNTKVCTYCQGIGNVVKPVQPPSKRVIGQRCPICGGSGVAANR